MNVAYAQSRAGAVSAALQHGVASGRVPGVVACAANATGEIYRGAFGVRDVLGGDAMEQDTLFFIASMTKTVTTVAVMQLVEQGRLSLDDPAARFLPWLGQMQVLIGFHADGTPMLRPARGFMTVRHLVAYTAGFAYPHWNELVQRYVAWAGLPSTVSGQEQSLDLPLVSDPGERWHYGICSELLGKIVESVSGERLDHYFRRHILDPLGMVDTTYAPESGQLGRLARIHSRMQDGSLSPIDFGPPDYVDYYPGGVGLFSTASDYLKLVCMLLRGGALNGTRILRLQTVALLNQDQLAGAAMEPMRSCDPFWSCDVDLFPGQQTAWGLGFLLNTSRSEQGREAFSLGWGGACNTFFWIDPTREIAGVFMTSLVPFCDPGALATFAAFERAIFDML